MDDSNAITPDLIKEECRKYLSSPATYEYDEDHMLDLIEYAIDESDYTSAWLLIGAALTHFSDNSFIWLHLGYLLYEDGQYDYARILLEKYQHTDFWAQSLLVLIDAQTQPDKAADGLRRLVEETKIFHSDSLVNVISVAEQTNNFELLCQLMPTILEKCDAREQLWREMIALAEDKAEHAKQKQLIEAYIDAFPYDSRAWELRARYYLRTEPNADEATSSADYALAVNPDSVSANILRYEALTMRMQGTATKQSAERESAFDAILNSVGKLSEPGPDLEIFADFVARYSLQTDRRIQQLTYDLNQRFPDNRAILDLMLAMTEDNAEWEIQEFIIKEFYKHDSVHPTTEYMWVDWARALRGARCFHASLAVLHTYYTNERYTFTRAADKDAYLEMLYLEKRYDEILQIEVSASAPTTYDVRIMFHKMLVWAWKGEYSKVRATAVTLMHDITETDAWTSLSNRLGGESMASVCVRLIDWASHHTRTRQQLLDIDPYGPIINLFAQ